MTYKPNELRAPGRDLLSPRKNNVIDISHVSFVPSKFLATIHRDTQFAALREGFENLKLRVESRFATLPIHCPSMPVTQERQ